MGEAETRWSVTYTKHVKQKRKVYQDGAMEVLRLSSGVEKATLYDESGSVLASRYLKREECVECGGSLDLGSHLVDVGDREGDGDGGKGFGDVEGKRDVKFVGRVGRFGGKSTGFGSSNNSNLIDTKKRGMGRNGASDGLRNLIRDDKRGGMSATAMSKGNEAARQEKIGVPRNCPTSTEISAKEWNALYTTQITQKAKKYHDGTLRLEFRGSHGQQVMLYNSTGIILDTRFLKKDEVVCSGGTLIFDAHLVDVGEPKENNEGALGSAGCQQKQKIQQDFKKEWHAMYTTQKTQKSKKYHDGILRLSVSICSQKQVTLLNEDGAVLSSKYLNSAADIRTGNSIEFANYLVDVGDPTMLRRADQQNQCSSQEAMHSFTSSSKLDKSHGGDNRGKGETKGSFGKGSHAVSSNVDKRTACGNAELMRNAHQILFTLKRPIAQPSSDSTNKSQLQPIHSLQSSQFESTIQDKPSERDMRHLNLAKNEVIYDIKDSLQNSEERVRSTMSICGSNISHSKAAEGLANIEIKNTSDEPKFNISIGLANFNIPASEPDVRCPEISTKVSISSIANYRVPNTDQPEDAQTQDEIKLTSRPSGDDVKITNNDAYENSSQHSTDMVDDGRFGECTTVASSIPRDSGSPHVNDGEGKSVEKKMNARGEKMKVDEFPSFDLGF